ncbi:hypothetical protein [Halomonas binhaiensis]|uniref:Uncharacterized protein n=1 Tax=Halomonas binhaiensis TaxID=2562282 RepID=A0A5C1NBW6_9GAMM|nr:hypothetical protein [Halomonas binhaiensis]QEM80684.1 hypothetical protein E4T21_03250 [Halomonas binhaiensis]
MIRGGLGDMATTLALGEEDGGGIGGGGGCWATTLALGEEEPWDMLSSALDIDFHFDFGWN